jgi:ATP-binding cassette subfamily C (CFTR/MRP) protein 1
MSFLWRSSHQSNNTKQKTSPHISLTNDDEDNLSADDATSGDSSSPLPWPEYSSSLWSRCSFSWVSPLIKQGYERPLTLQDLYSLPQHMSVDSTVEELTENFQRFSGSKLAILWAILATYKWQYFLPLYAQRLLVLILILMKPVVLRSFIEKVSASEYHAAFLFAVVLTLLTIFIAWLRHWFYWNNVKLALTLRGALVGMIYRKLLRLDNSYSLLYNSGRITNLASVDCDNLKNFFWDSYQEFWAGIITLIGAILGLFYVLGAATLVGLAVLLISLVFTSRIAKIMAEIHAETMKIADQRSAMINEMLNTIKFIKLFTWESFFTSKVMKIRVIQQKLLLKLALLGAINRTWGLSASQSVSFCVFGSYVYYFQRNLSPETAFTALMLFGIVQEPLVDLPECILVGVKSFVSALRIREFLLSPERIVYLNTTQSIKPMSSVLQLINVSVDFGGALPEEMDETSGEMGASLVASGSDSDEESQNLLASAAHPSGNASGRNSRELILSIGPTEGSRIILREVNLAINKGELIMICGAVGSGKSALLLSILNEMRLLTGSINCASSVAYTAQSPYLVSNTVQFNILNGLSFDSARFLATLQACALMQDVGELPRGVDTMIGSSGLRLSGGQKHRINLARAVYSNCESYLCDDFFSAVDVNVARTLWDGCISNSGILKGKTRLLVTHQLQFAHSADRIIIMEGGQIKHCDSYKRLLEKGIDFAKLVQQTHASQSQLLENKQEKPGKEHNSHEGVENGGRRLSLGKDELDLIANNLAEDYIIEGGASTPRRYVLGSAESEDEQFLSPSSCQSSETAKTVQGAGKFDENDSDLHEKIAQGAVASSVYKEYFSAAASVLGWIMVFVLVISSQASANLTDYLLAQWSQAASSADKTYITGYGLLCILSLFLLFFRTIYIAWVTARAGNTLHNRLFNALLAAPQWWHESIPTGRIMNRCNKDQEQLDTNLPSVIQDIVACLIIVIGTIVFVMILVPLSAIPISVAILLYYYVQDYYRPSSRELKRLEAVSRTPIYQQIQETHAGLVTIRAFAHNGCVERNIDECDKRINHNTRLYISAFSVHRWVGVRLEAIGSSIVFITTTMSVLLIDSLGIGLVSLAVTTALNLSRNLNWTVRQISEMEVQMNSVERVLEYAGIASEEEIRSTQNLDPLIAPPNDWPSEGGITVNNYSASYNPNPSSPLVLKNITLSIKSGEKIGIVGRTGSGKSSFCLALFGLMTTKSGTISIDDIDVSKISLNSLRSKISVITQDAVIFQGLTMRENLNGKNKHSDAQLQHLMNSLTLPVDLDSTSHSYSAGECQLINLARTSLRSSSIIICDEHAANLDFETEHKIKQFIAATWKDKTIITIAHRLNTILNSDRIIVFSTGKIVEFDTPSALLSNPTGYLSSLIKDSTAITRDITSSTTNQDIFPA